MMLNLNFRFILPVILAVLIGVIVSFAVQGFISFVTLVESFLRGDQHILLGLPKEVLIFSGPVIAGTIVAIIYKLANLDRWHGPAESILAAHVPSKRPNTEAGLLSTLASAVSIAGGASVGQYGPLVHFGGVIGFDILPGDGPLLFGLPQITALKAKICFEKEKVCLAPSYSTLIP
mgnify:CR=1 FL=1